MKNENESDRAQRKKRLFSLHAFETLSAHLPGYIYTHLDWPKPRQKAVSAPGGTDTFKEPRGAQTLEHPIEPSTFWPRPSHSAGVVDTLLRRSGANLGCEDRSANIAGSTRSQRAKLDVALALLHASPGATIRRDRV